MTFGPGWCETCFCFRDIRRAVVAIGLFSLATSTLQILTTVAVFTGSNAISDPIMFDHQDKEVITYELYIALSAMDFFVAVFSIVVLYGNERTDEARARKYLLPWLILIPFYVIYESAINIFYFYNQFNMLYEGPLGQHAEAIGFHIVPLVYWVVKVVILIICFVFLIVRYQTLAPHTIKYVERIHENGVCNDYYAGPTLHAPMALPAPPACTSCSGGCPANRCPKCNQIQPSYGYAAGPPAGKSGWMTTVYSGGR